MDSIPTTPLFVKTHDFNVWLLNHTQRFPKNLRHSYSVRLESLAFDFEEALLTANTLRGAARQDWLIRADAKLLALRALFRYAADLKLLGGNQLAFAAQSMGELGRLLGAWRKGTAR